MADLTGDGIDDLFSGCFEGGLYVLSGRQDGSFSAPEALLDRAGNVLRIGQYWDYDAKEWTGVETSKYKESLGISGTAVDWDADGDLDLVLGTFEGKIFLRLNEGSAKEPAWATESLPVTAGGEPIQVVGRHSMPVCVDWDGDGLFDLVTGSGAGGVSWYRNVGERGAPDFDRARELLAPPGDSSDASRPGKRTQVHVTDFDADGDLDLLVGDYHRTQPKDGSKAEMHGWVWFIERVGPAASD